MARYIPQVKKTVFFVGEGDNEQCFLKHLKSLFSRKNAYITIRSAGGKNPDYITDKALRMSSSQNYDKKIIFLDADKALTSAKREKAGRCNFEIIWNKPCLEGFFLELLEGNKSWTDKNSVFCKKYFQKKYLPTIAIFNDKICSKIFTEAVLTHASLKNRVLKQLINIFSGKF